MPKPEDDNEPFLSRWARRKRDARREDVAAGAPVADASAGADASGAAAQPKDAAGKTSAAEPPLDLSKLPKVEEMTAQTDITAFLDARVPAMLRNAALSRMWALDPTIRDFIEVAENQWNWNVPGGAPFYEMIEPGSLAGINVADATSAIARTISEESVEVAAVSSDLSAETEAQKVDPTAVEHVALQHEIATEAQAPFVSGEREASVVSEDSLAATNQVALQQDAERPRRRHGGALPT